MTTRILHGSIALYTTKNRKSVEKQLEKWLFRLIRLSTGMMRQTPFPFRKLYSGLKSLTKKHIKLTHNYLHNILMAPIDDAYRELVWGEIHYESRTNLSSLNNLIEKRALLQQHFTRAETLSPFPVPPWNSQLTNVIKLPQTKTQAKDKISEKMSVELEAGTLKLFVHGSLIPGKGGGVAEILTNTSSKKVTYFGRDSVVTNFETELVALSLCQELLTN
ncbi:hypothetical protein O181_028696 [Austropuccinia psidii MF-1]|uniref:Uncharacterized protein n=1 Tax=Austropuccinia psidii MF-1 TaxID=1389203 RepID=A0A9Q3H2M2_9BASI|nr:hypothetical protein [Austropuccinia psidii MF-1]